MRIVHFADLHLGVESYGRTDPATGLSTRLLDFLAALDTVANRALEGDIDLVLFCGDAYKSREPSQTQQREFARRIARIAGAGIPVLLLVGNHDLPNATGRATSVEIFDTLATRNTYVAGRPGTLVIPTRSGPLQIVTLPWATRSSLLAREEYKNTAVPDINKLIEDKLTGILYQLCSELQEGTPAVLAGHVRIPEAVVGSERSMLLGPDHVVLSSNLAHHALDYVALGHIHRRQSWDRRPPLVYAGSLQPVDFSEEASEEAEDKGFYVVEIDKERGTDFQFQPVQVRPFLTIEVHIADTDLDPTATVLRAIAGHQDAIRDAIVRVRIDVPETGEGLIHENRVRDALAAAHSIAAISREVRRQPRLRLGNSLAEGTAPLQGLKSYLESKKISPERAGVLLEHAQKLIAEREREES
ncbi:MAG: exonuclease SbcCD subunit D [Chloroflexi bacterium]|nr:exonuclease SbcCD subunit D [Chloroflexota bacterium]